MNIMLTGATGHLGTHITNQAIANHIDHFHIGVRNVEKVPEDWRGKVPVRQLDYFNQESMVEAFKGMDTVVFIPSIIHPSFKRIPEVENLVYAAKQAALLISFS